MENFVRFYVYGEPHVSYKLVGYPEKNTFKPTGADGSAKRYDAFT